MNYVLIGNGPTTDIGAITQNADHLIQINYCKYATQVPANRTRYIFITNAGPENSELLGNIQKAVEHAPFAQFVLARNPYYYALKRCLLRILGRYDNRWYRINREFQNLESSKPILRVSFFFSLMLDLKLYRMGMPPSHMPSTGMVAYEWIKKKMHAGDDLSLEGFTFEGWDRHHWEIEKTLIKPLHIPFNWEAEGFWQKS